MNVRVSSNRNNIGSRNYGFIVENTNNYVVNVNISYVFSGTAGTTSVAVRARQSENIFIGRSNSSSPLSISQVTVTGQSSQTINSLTVTIVNNTGYRIEEAYISPRESSNWGVELLNGRTIASGREIQVTVTNLSASSTYDIMLVDYELDAYVKFAQRLGANARVTFTMTDLNMDF